MSDTTTVRTLPIEDRLAVQDLLARYGWYVDENRGDDWAALYASDGIFEGTRPAPVVGTADLRKVPGELTERFGGRLRHQISNLYVEAGEDSDDAVAHFYTQVGQWNEGYTPVMLAVSRAILRRIDGVWRIQRNTIRPLA